jgi:hypothetical protein
MVYFAERAQEEVHTDYGLLIAEIVGCGQATFI